MKKLFLSVAAIGLLASCSQNEIQDVTENSNEIKFSTLNDKVTTRAANDTKSNYRVFAKLTGTGAATAWFMDEKMEPVAGIGNSSNGFENFTGADAIASGKKVYWPSNTGWTLNFYGFAPHDAAGANYNPSVEAGLLPITYTVKTHATDPDAQEDFTIAIPKSYTVVPTGKKVQNQFKHMLTKIMIATPVLTDELTNAGYAIAYKQEGTPVKPLTPSLNVINVTGTIEATTAAATTTPTTWTDLKDANPKDPEANLTTYTGANQYMILPQPAAGNQIVLPIVITKGGVVVFDGDVTYQFTGSDISHFLPGKNYQMNTTISNSSADSEGGAIFGPEITFSSEVADWSQNS